MNYEPTRPTKPQNFVTVNRSILADYHNKKICRGEYLIFLHLRVSCDPYGRCHTSLSDINQDVFGGLVGKNYINKLLLSLKSKKLLWFERRQGSRGVFIIEFGDLVLPNKKIKTLNIHHEPNTETPKDSSGTRTESEEANKSPSPSHNFAAEKKALASQLDAKRPRDEVRGDYNDTDTYKDIESIDSKSSYKGKVLVKDFTPKCHDEQRCQDIAQELGEEFMDFILSALRKYGIQTIERAWGLVKESSGVRDKRRYFNDLVIKLGEESLGGGNAKEE